MSLSIFNFDNLNITRRFLGQYVREISLLVFVFVLTTAICILLLLQINQQTGSRLDNVYADKIQTLVLGNSQLEGLVAEDQRVLNLALAGSDYSIQYQILRYVMPRLKNINTVVLGFDNIPLRTPAIARMRGDFSSLSHMGVPWYAIPETSLLDRLKFMVIYNRWARPLLVGPRFEADRLLSWLDDSAHQPVNRPNSQNESSGPDQIRPGFYLAPAQGTKKIEDYIRALDTDNNLDTNLIALDQIVDFCSDHKIKLILLRPPTTLEFRAGRSQEWQDELSLVYQHIADRHPEMDIPFWDADQAAAYVIELFDDPNHLSSTGKQRFSSYILSRLEPLLQR